MTAGRPNRRQFLTATGLTLLAGCTSGRGLGGDASAAETPALTVSVGELVETSGFSFVLRAVTKTKTLNAARSAGRNDTYLILRFAVKNTSDEVVHWFPWIEPYVGDTAGNEYYLADDQTTHVLPKNHDLLPGEVSRGDVVYAVPEDAANLTYHMDFGNRKQVSLDEVVIDLESKTTPVTDLKQTLQTPHLPGEIVSHDDVSVTVTGVRTETELEDDATAMEGHEFVIPTVEITNQRSDSVSFVPLWNMRLKDGSGLSHTHDNWAWEALDEGLDATSVAAGRTTRGDMAYQLPTDRTQPYFMFDWYNVSAQPFKAFWRL